MLEFNRIEMDWLLMALDDHDEMTAWYIDARTGEVFSHSELFDDEPSLDPDSREDARAIDPFPSHVGYRDMEDFIAQVPDARAADLLARAIVGRGAFRRFKDTLGDFPTLLLDWFAFRDLRARSRAIGYLRDHELITDDAAAAALADLETAAAQASNRHPVTPRLRQIVLDSTDARAAAEFWRALLGLVYRSGHEPPTQGMPDPAGRDWLNLHDPDGTPRLAFQQVDALPRATWPATGVPQQLHLDLSVRTAAQLATIRDRVLELGGTHLLDRADDPDEPLHAFADPDGHPFCVFVAED